MEAGEEGGGGKEGGKGAARLPGGARQRLQATFTLMMFISATSVVMLAHFQTCAPLPPLVPRLAARFYGGHWCPPPSPHGLGGPRFWRDIERCWRPS